MKVKFMLNLYKKLKGIRKYILFFCDFVIWNISYYLSFAVNRNSFSLKGEEDTFINGFFVLNICFFMVFSIFKLYDNIWRYADIEDFFYAEIAVIAANFSFFALTLALHLNLGIRTYVLFLLMSSFLIFIFRLVYRINKLTENNNISGIKKRRLLIVGGGESAASILREISKFSGNEYLPICIVDDDRAKIGRRILGVEIVGSTYEIPSICKNYEIEVILFSIYSINIQEKKRILDICTKTNLETRIIPSIYDLVTANIPIYSKIRKVELEDLLGREPIIFNAEQCSEYLINKNILVTGGGGSIGSELCRQIAKLSPKKLIILDIYENNAYNIQQELLRNYKNKLNFEIQIASIRDIEKLESIFQKENLDVIFHAAAHKHVPLMENNPEEAVKNNIFGTLNLITLADKYKINKFVQISTDKAVNPANIMGVTKRICEMLVQSMGSLSKTEFVAVRFGNVLGSSGSVIPLFKEQIRLGGPVTVTHPEIIRYFMTIEEAVSLVMTAGSLAKGGEIFILDMGNPVKIKDLAENLIRLSGLVPNEDIKIIYTGLRPGEKLYEELLLNEEGIKKTENKKIYIGNPIKFNYKELMKALDTLYEAVHENDKNKIKKILKTIVPTFKEN